LWGNLSNLRSHTTQSDEVWSLITFDFWLLTFAITRLACD
jgi:hypothetical protein